MTRWPMRSTLCVALYAGVVVALAIPASASAHAYLVRTAPSASGVVNTPPAQVLLTYDEAVEPRFAIISVTDKDGHQVTAGHPKLRMCVLWFQMICAG